MADRWLGHPSADWLIATALAFGGWLIGGTDGSSFLAGTDPVGRSGLYQTLANIAGGLLGFYIATVAILLGLDSDRPRMKAALSNGRRSRVQSFFFAGIRAAGLVLTVFVASLVLDKHENVSPWIEPVLVAGATLLALRTIRIIWLLNAIVGIASHDQSEQS